MGLFDLASFDRLIFNVFNVFYDFQLNLLREEGAPLTPLLTMMSGTVSEYTRLIQVHLMFRFQNIASCILQVPPGKKTVFNAPNTCPVCAKVMQNQGDFIAHMQTHEGNALQQWRTAKIRMLKVGK